MRRLVKFLLLISVVMVFMGCAVQSAYMQPVGPEVSYTPASNEAVVVFMRPSRMGGAVQSSVFDVTTDKNVLVGVVSSKTKVAHKVKPGEHLFMVVGESADFMKANVKAGKTYYAVVTPRMGVWKARFSLDPVNKAELGKAEFKSWDNACKFVENTEASHQWARDNAASIQQKRTGYYQKWIAKPETERPVLNKEDGI
jgi:hypothetical protein